MARAYRGTDGVEVRIQRIFLNGPGLVILEPLGFCGKDLPPGGGMGGPTTAPQQGLILPQRPFRDELASEASEPSEARRAVTPFLITDPPILGKKVNDPPILGYGYRNAGDCYLPH